MPRSSKPAAETPVQAQALSDAFTGALSQLQNSLGEANQALQGIAGFISQQQGNVGYLQSLNTACQSAVDKSIATNRDNLIGQLSCGGDDVQDQFNGMQAVVDASFVSLQAPFAAVNSQFETAMQAASVVPGVFVNLQTSSQSVTDQLNQAQSYPPDSPLRTMHLNIAMSLWADLVTYAKAQLLT
jgi:hypothetical protein